ncbi:uncharacterized protein LOC106775549 isoform X1 [Vigna radiata var. radiata]|uniref:Uncharacterized protein LOC106775549 isoform X1 n=1 Tax=Vigna radiata var. radiata TaxID=3916 RepID=A0A1S3VII9_VIGRR|nr:uncharacterized protein LOC106775549 isoform X1 [Vigna radiata var. radiata]XP_014518178.1 uncharacterized protein LOC106775549 isoform X1 [Vigna radiata var. radiata]
MCSNSCNSVCGCGSGVNVVSSIWSSGLKKPQKRPRVPKRGPGVAELEKILREQGSVDITTEKGDSEGFPSFVSRASSSLNFHPLQPSTTTKTTPPSSLTSNLATNVSSAPIFDHLGPTTLPASTSMYGKCGSLERSGGSGLVSPEKEFFPLNLNSCKSNLNMNEPIDGNRYDSASSPSRNLSGDWPYSKNQHINNHYSAPITSMTNLRGTSTIGPQNQPELPSNQSLCYNYMSRVPEEQKVGMKRSHSSTLENSLIPPSNFHVLPSFSYYNRHHQSSINDSHGVSGFNSTKECYKDAKWGSTLELSNTRFNSDMTVPGHANFPPVVTPEVPSPPMHLFSGVISKGNALPGHVCEDKLDSCQHSESSEPNRRPFYNFLEVEDSEMTDKMQGDNLGGREAGRFGIDLNLKL